MNFYQKRIKYLKNRFNLEHGLELEGSPFTPKEKTLETLIKQRQEEHDRQYQSCYGFTEYREQDVFMGLEIRRPNHF